MNRLRIATIFGTLSVAAYFFVICTVTMFAGQSEFQVALMVPLSLLEGFFSESFDGLVFARDLPVVCTLWLTFVCIVDLSVLLSTIKVEDSLRLFAIASSLAKRSLISLHVIERRILAGL